MKESSKRSRSLYASVLVALVLILAACGGGGIDNEEAEQIRNDIDEVQARLDNLDARISELAEGDADTDAVASEAQQEIAAARDTLAQVDERLAPPPPPEDDGDAFGDPGAPAF